MMSRLSYCSLGARKGRVPTTMRQSMTPKAQTSALAPTQGCFLTISGDMQAGVPQQLLSMMFELALNPKSMILTEPWSSMRMFSGLRSRWQTPFSWQQEIPSRICLKNAMHLSSLRTLSFLITPQRLCFPPFQRIRQSFFLSLATPTSLITLACDRFLRCLIYLLIQAKRFQSSAQIFSYVLMAQFRWSSLPTAKDTTEKAPFPMCDIILQHFSASGPQQTSSKQPVFSVWLVEGRVSFSEGAI